MVATAFDFPEVYGPQGLDLNVSNLGCIMLDVAPFEVRKHVTDADTQLFFGTTPELKYAQGSVAERSAHVTLLYGLLEKGTKWRGHVDAVLDGWQKPDSITIDKVEFFPGRQGYDVIIGKVKKTPAILEAHNRLSLLPHINTHPGYVPHVTLAYVVSPEGGYTEKWVEQLSPVFNGAELKTTTLNYGGSNTA